VSFTVRSTNKLDKVASFGVKLLKIELERLKKTVVQFKLFGFKEGEWSQMN